MLLGIDHIVIAVPDLDAAMKNYRRLGFTVVPGGKHPVGSHNGLIAFADGAYIELISFYRDHPGHRWWAALKRGGGLVDFCMQTDDLLGDTAKLRGAGVHIDDPVPWSRTRPDGYELKWLLSLARGEHRGVAPFLIQDQTPRAERVPRETRHDNGAAGIGAVIVALDDLAPARRWYEAALGSGGATIDRRDIGAAGGRFKIGPHRLEYLAPLSTDSLLYDWLEARGPSPFSATLRGRKEAAQPDRSLTCGAALSFE
jgi:catechol 2,3-dioxygenase-like lactoylglutathione lyase family enzyme